MNEPKNMSVAVLKALAFLYKSGYRAATPGCLANLIEDVYELNGWPKPRRTSLNTLVSKLCGSGKPYRSIHDAIEDKVLVRSDGSINISKHILLHS
jgi:hypothetical protein